MKTFIGTTKSTKMTNTAAVEVERLWQHPIYKKRVKRTKSFLAHNAIGAKEGDRVLIAETRPLSKRKCWVIKEIIKKN